MHTFLWKNCENLTAVQYKAIRWDSSVSKMAGILGFHSGINSIVFTCVAWDSASLMSNQYWSVKLTALLHLVLWSGTHWAASPGENILLSMSRVDPSVPLKLLSQQVDPTTTQRISCLTYRMHYLYRYTVSRDEYWWVTFRHWLVRFMNFQVLIFPISEKAIHNIQWWLSKVSIYTKQHKLIIDIDPGESFDTFHKAVFYIWLL
jgi:hypothetical protein